MIETKNIDNLAILRKLKHKTHRHPTYVNLMGLIARPSLVDLIEYHQLMLKIDRIYSGAVGYDAYFVYVAEMISQLIELKLWDGPLNEKVLSNKEDKIKYIETTFNEIKDDVEIFIKIFQEYQHLEEVKKNKEIEIQNNLKQIEHEKRLKAAKKIYDDLLFKQTTISTKN